MSSKWTPLLANLGSLPTVFEVLQQYFQGAAEAGCFSNITFSAFNIVFSGSMYGWWYNRITFYNTIHNKWVERSTNS